MISIRKDPLLGKIIVAEGDTRKGGAYIARVVGPDPRWRYERHFLGTSEHPARMVKRVVVPTSDLADGDLLDIRDGAWETNFYVFQEGRIRKISEHTLRVRLAQKLGVGGDST